MNSLGPPKLPRSYQEIVTSLGRLDFFDAKVFRGDSATPQYVADFVLTLGLIYNDYRDLIIAGVLLRPQRPADVTALTPERGEFAGLEVHVMRLHASLLHELLNLIADSAKAIAHPSLTQIIRGLPAAVRTQWRTLVDAAQGKRASTRLGRLLLLTRNKLLFHYDVKAIGRGYRLTFEEGKLPETGAVPCLSRGDRLARSRFYFADAAAQAFLDAEAGSGYQQFLNDLEGPLEALNFALYNIVTAFIQSRGAFRSVP